MTLVMVEKSEEEEDREAQNKDSGDDDLEYRGGKHRDSVLFLTVISILERCN